MDELDQRSQARRVVNMKPSNRSSGRLFGDMLVVVHFAMYQSTFAPIATADQLTELTSIYESNSSIMLQGHE